MDAFLVGLSTGLVGGAVIAGIAFAAFVQRMSNAWKGRSC